MQQAELALKQEQVRSRNVQSKSHLEAARSEQVARNINESNLWREQPRFENLKSKEEERELAF